MTRRPLLFFMALCAALLFPVNASAGVFSDSTEVPRSCLPLVQSGIATKPWGGPEEIPPDDLVSFYYFSNLYEEGGSGTAFIGDTEVENYILDYFEVPVEHIRKSSQYNSRMGAYAFPLSVTAEDYSVSVTYVQMSSILAGVKFHYALDGIHIGECDLGVYMFLPGGVPPEGHHYLGNRLEISSIGAPYLLAKSVRFDPATRMLSYIAPPALPDPEGYRLALSATINGEWLNDGSVVGEFDQPGAAYEVEIPMDPATDVLEVHTSIVPYYGGHPSRDINYFTVTFDRDGRAVVS